MEYLVLLLTCVLSYGSFHHGNALILKKNGILWHNMDFSNIPKICEFWSKTSFFTNNVFFFFVVLFCFFVTFLV